jgi:hypothetical protein
MRYRIGDTIVVEIPMLFSGPSQFALNEVFVTITPELIDWVKSRPKLRAHDRLTLENTRVNALDAMKPSKHPAVRED